MIGKLRRSYFDNVRLASNFTLCRLLGPQELFYVLFPRLVALFTFNQGHQSLDSFFDLSVSPITRDAGMRVGKSTYLLIRLDFVSFSHDIVRSSISHTLSTSIRCFVSLRKERYDERCNNTYWSIGEAGSRHTSFLGLYLAPSFSPGLGTGVLLVIYPFPARQSCLTW